MYVYGPHNWHSTAAQAHALYVLFLNWILSTALLSLLNTTRTEKVLGKLLLGTSVEVEQTTFVHQVTMSLLDHLY